MYAQAENPEPGNKDAVCGTLHHYLPADADVLKKHTAGNKYVDDVMTQRQSSSGLGHGGLQTLDFPLSHKFPQNLKAPGLFRSERVSVMPASSSSKHMGQFSFFPKTINHEGGMFSAQRSILAPPFMCQLPKHILASQVCFSSHFLYFFQV